MNCHLSFHLHNHGTVREKLKVKDMTSHQGDLNLLYAKTFCCTEKCFIGVVFVITFP